MNKQNPPRKGKAPRKPGPDKRLENLEKAMEKMETRQDRLEVLLNSLEDQFNQRFAVLGQIKGRNEPSYLPLELKSNVIYPLFGDQEYE